MKSLPDLCVAFEQGLKCGVYELQMGLVFKTNPSSPEAAGNIQEPGVRKPRICFIPASTWTRMTLLRSFHGYIGREDSKVRPSRTEQRKGPGVAAGPDQPSWG